MAVGLTAHRNLRLSDSTGGDCRGPELHLRQEPDWTWCVYGCTARKWCLRYGGAGGGCRQWHKPLLTLRLLHWLAPVPILLVTLIWLVTHKSRGTFCSHPPGSVSCPCISAHPHLPSCNPRQTVGCTVTEGSEATRLSSAPSASSSGSGMYSMQSTGAATGKDLTVRGEGRFREKISTWPPAPSCPPPT